MNVRKNSNSSKTVEGSFPNFSIISTTGFSQAATCSAKSAKAVHICILIALEPEGADGCTSGDKEAMRESRSGNIWGSGISFRSYRI